MTRIVPMPAHVNPADPKSLSASINYGVSLKAPPREAHPLKHSDDYGKGRDRSVAANDETPDEREDWLKADWEALAESYGLAKSGTVPELKERIADHEANLDTEEN